MPIMGINITKLSIEKGNPPVPQVEVDLTPKVTGIRLGEMRTPTGKLNGIEVLFEYGVTYKPDVAKASIEGVIFYLPRNRDDVDRILDEWENEKKLDPNMFAEVVNAVTMEAMPLLMLLSKELRLPYPIPVPRVNVTAKA